MDGNNLLADDHEAVFPIIDAYDLADQADAE